MELRSGKITSQPPPPNDEGDKCSICQDTELFKDMYALPCAHKFHELCINEWLKKKSICPICRFRIGDANDTYDEGLGEVDEADTEFSEHFFNGVFVIRPPNGELLESHMEFISSDEEEEEDEELLTGQFSRASEGSSYEESRDSSDEGLEVHVHANIFAANSESDTEPENNESNAEADHNEFDDNYDGGSETSESYYEPETIVLDDTQETSEYDEEPDVSESDDERDTSESEDGSESSESSDEPEITVLGNEPESIVLDDESETSQSSDEPDVNESDDEQENSESDDESDVYESNSESYYDSDTE